MKKFLLILLCVAMTAAIIACSGGQTPGVSEPPEDVQPPTNDPTDSPDSANKTFDENNVVLSFGAISDIHITGNGGDSESKFRAALTQLKAEAAKHDKNGLDAITIAGDIADTGKASQVNAFTKLVKNSGIANVMLVPGNHDHSGDSVATLKYYIDTMGEKYYKNDVDFTMIDKGARHCVLNGVHFIFIEPAQYGSNCPYRQDVLTWLNNTLKQITEADPNAYVFVYTHPMVYDTCYGSDLPDGFWYTTYLTSILSKYPQVVTFGGHLHFPVNDERSIMQTKFTSLGCGSVRYLAIERGYSNMASATVPHDAYSVSSGLLVQIDANGNLRITKMDFSNNTTFKEPWEISYPTEDGAHLKKYGKDRAKSNKAPTLTGTPKLDVTVSPTTNIISGATLTVPAGSDDDLVHHYEVTIKNKTTGTTVTYKYLSDFYRHPQPSSMAKTLSFPLEIAVAGEYMIDVVAVDSWDAKSGKITCEVSVSGAGGNLSAELPDVYTDFEFKNGAVTDTNGKFDIKINGATVVNTQLTFAGKTANTDAFKVSALGQNAVVRFKDYTSATLSNFYNSSMGFSIEALYTNYAPGGTQGIVCGTQSPGGWGLAEKDGVPYLFTYVGSGNINISINKASSKKELNHVVCTMIYDSASNKTYSAIYLNGKLVNSGSYTGKIRINSTNSVGTAFCLGADISAAGTGSDFGMKNFVLADAKIYVGALNYEQVNTAYNNAVENFGN
ncbi:MAG: metallophosphoesterase [Clostridia bacterium]|nr:metallophosphoesterase [Clostridia bacterium]